jgi:hypothetical protein
MSSWDAFVELAKDHGPEVLGLLLALVASMTFLIVFPQIQRTHMRREEMIHQEHLKALEKGVPLPVDDYRARMAGRTALWVPIVVMLATACVTSLLVIHHPENLFAVSLAIWVVAGVVSTAAITGGVALIGRLAQFQSGQTNEEEETDDQDSPYANR